MQYFKRCFCAFTLLIHINLHDFFLCTVCIFKLSQHFREKNTNTVFHSCLEFHEKTAMRTLKTEFSFVFILTKVYILVTLFILSIFLNPQFRSQFLLKAISYSIQEDLVDLILLKQACVKFAFYIIFPRLSCVTFHKVVYRIKLNYFLVLRRHGAYQFPQSLPPGRVP